MNLSISAFTNIAKPYYWGIILLLFATACKRQQLQKSVDNTTATQTEAKKDSTIAVVPVVVPTQPAVVVAPKPEFDELKNKVDEIDFEYLSSQAKISFKSTNPNVQGIEDANLSFRMKKDSIIWFNIRVAIIDVVRGVITKDGIEMNDMYNKVYYQNSYDSLSKKFGVKLDFSLIQAVIVGNMPIRKKPREVRKEKDYLLLKQNDGKIMVDNYIGDGNRKLKKLLVEDQPTKNSLKLEYDDFQSLNSFLFPYSSLLTIDSQSKTDNLPYQTVIRIKYKKVELPVSPLSFPFKVPAGYERK